MSSPVHRNHAPAAAPAAPRGPAAPQRRVRFAGDVLEPAENPPRTPRPRRREEGCGICSCICRCLVELFRAICRLFCCSSAQEREVRPAPQDEAPQLNAEQRTVATFLDRFPKDCNEGSEDRRVEFFEAFQKLPPAAQRAARNQLYMQRKAAVDEALRDDRDDPVETKRPYAPVVQSQRDAVIDKMIVDDFFNYAIREALNRFIGREEETVDEE